MIHVDIEAENFSEHRQKWVYASKTGYLRLELQVNLTPRTRSRKKLGQAGRKKGAKDSGQLRNDIDGSGMFKHFYHTTLANRTALTESTWQIQSLEDREVTQAYLRRRSAKLPHSDSNSERFSLP